MTRSSSTDFVILHESSRAILTVRAAGILDDSRKRQKTLTPADQEFYAEVQRGKSEAEIESEHVSAVLAQ